MVVSCTGSRITKVEIQGDSITVVQGDADLYSNAHYGVWSLRGSILVRKQDNCTSLLRHYRSNNGNNITAHKHKHTHTHTHTHTHRSDDLHIGDLDSHHHGPTEDPPVDFVTDVRHHIVCTYSQVCVVVCACRLFRDVIQV